MGGIGTARGEYEEAASSLSRPCPQQEWIRVWPVLGGACFGFLVLPIGRPYPPQAWIRHWEALTTPTHPPPQAVPIPHK